MQFDLTPEEQNFREELRAFLDEMLPDSWTGPPDESKDEDWELTLRIRRELAERGWLVMSWPEEYGGRGASPMMNLVFAEEMAYRRAPGNDRFGTRMIGPTLMQFGTDEQKRRFLPAIARGDIQWCQGYSEPNTGSDLASLQTRAENDGDEFVITGTKIWTSMAHRADWMFMLARTDPDAPRHRGISFLLCEMKSDGLSVDPIINMSGSHGFNQINFDSVRVPKASLIGRVNEGWNVAMWLLNAERTNIDYVAWAQRSLDEIVDFTRAHKSADGRVLVEDREVRRRIADLDAEIEATRLMTYEVAWRQSRGETVIGEASMSKVAATEANLRVLDFGLELLGMYGQLVPGSAHAEMEGRMLKMRLYYTSGPILAGTNEIQKNIVAQRGLGLPRG